MLWAEIFYGVYSILFISCLLGHSQTQDILTDFRWAPDKQAKMVLLRYSFLFREDICKIIVSDSVLTNTVRSQTSR